MAEKICYALLLLNAAVASTAATSTRNCCWFYTNLLFFHSFFSFLFPEISANFKPDPDPALARLKDCSSPSPSSSPDPSLSQLSPATPQTADTPPQISSPLSVTDATGASPEHRRASSSSEAAAAATTGDGGRLEDFLETTTGGETLLSVEEPGGPLTLMDDLHSQMLSAPSMLDHHPPMPMDTYELSYSVPATGLDFADAALDSMDWLDITMGGGGGGSGGSGGDTSPAHGTGSLGAPSGPPVPTSIFSADFLDSPDLQLHWDSCL